MLLAMAGKLYTPVRLPGVHTLLLRLTLVILLLCVTVLGLYWEGGLIDKETGRPARFLDCVYFTFVTITTVGYGDIVPVGTGPRLADAFLLTPVRFIVIFMFFGTAYQLIIKRFQEDYRMKRAVDKLHDHVIVCGYGATGRAAIQELLLQGTPADQIVVLATSEASLKDAADLGVVSVSGDAAHESVLKSVAIDRVAHVLICPGRDDTAVLIALTVRDLNPQAQVIAMCHEAENVKLLERSGANVIISPAAAGGNLMAAATRQAHSHLVETMQDILSVGGALQLDERAVRPEEIGKRPGEIQGAAVMRVYRDGDYFDVPDLPMLKEGDTIVFVASGTAYNA